MEASKVKKELIEYQTNNEKGYLINTCLNSQDNYEKMAKYFLED